jgi:hypothetical protein
MMTKGKTVVNVTFTNEFFQSKIFVLKFKKSLKIPKGFMADFVRTGRFF